MKNKPTTRVTLEELFETLNFYAEQENHCSANHRYHMSPVETDMGKKARKILKKFLKDGFFYTKI